MIRFFLHKARESWAEVHVLDEPKVTARLIASLKQGGRYLGTCDKQPNEELFRDSQTRTNRVPSRTTTREMLARHQDFVLRTPGVLVRVEDPVKTHVEYYDAWIRRLLDSHQLVRRGDSVAIPLRQLFPTAFRALRAWFQ